MGVLCNRSHSYQKHSVIAVLFFDLNTEAIGVPHRPSGGHSSDDWHRPANWGSDRTWRAPAWGPKVHRAYPALGPRSPVAVVG